MNRSISFSMAYSLLFYLIFNRTAHAVVSGSCIIPAPAETDESRSTAVERRRKKARFFPPAM
jgi:hypothetical protein